MSPIFDGHLDTLGQQPLLKIYTQICSCYAVPENLEYAALLDKLNRGLERLAEAVPWTSGFVVQDEEDGLFKIAQKDGSRNQVIVNDLRDVKDAPTMATLRTAKFPMSMLDESITAPRTTLPHPGDESKDTPVFLVQATYVQGGLILSFTGQHQTMDMTGQGQLISLLSRACSGSPLTQEETELANMSRKDVVPLLDDFSNQEQESELLQKTEEAGSVAAPAPPVLLWGSFNISSARLTSLKQEASKGISTTFISTDDAVCALLWRAISRARRPRLSSSKPSLFARAVDVRRHFGVPSKYTGILQNMAYSTEPDSTGTQPLLGQYASALRSALDDTALRRSTQQFATQLHRARGKPSGSFTAALDLSRDLMLSSWAKVDTHTLDFGLGLGLPEAVRRPRFDCVESLVYLMPRGGDGEMNVAVCLREEDMAGLRADEEFAKYTEWVG